MSLDDKKEKSNEPKNTYVIEIQNGIACIHDNKVNNIAEWNLLHDILNTPKRTKKLNNHYSPILHICMKPRKVKAKFKSFKSYWILDVVPLL